MLVRIVKMKFRETEISNFLQWFEQNKHFIVAFEGCLEVELWQDYKDPCTFFTHSRWTDEQSLQNYRQSDFFKATWTRTKTLFEEPAQAWSVALVNKV